MCIHIYLYIYIYRERERERERKKKERKRDRKRDEMGENEKLYTYPHKQMSSRDTTYLRHVFLHDCKGKGKKIQKTTFPCFCFSVKKGEAAIST